MMRRLASLLAASLLASAAPAQTFTNGLVNSINDVVQYAQPVSGASIAMSPGMTLLIVDNPSLLLALTVTLPPNPVDGQRVIISSGAGVTVLTVNGGTVKGLITSLTLNGYARYSYSAQAGAWFRTG